MPSALSASSAAGYAGFLSTFITRGIGLPDASIAMRRKRSAAAVSRLAVSRNSIVWPVESNARYRYLSSAFYLYTGLVDPMTLIGRLQVRSAAFVQLRPICLHPTPNAAGLHLDTAFGHQFADVLIGERVAKLPAHAQNDHFSRELAPFDMDRAR
jgi:hypothetical protein